MCRGRTVQIKMSSATAWTGSIISLLFVSLTANCSKVLLQQLQRSCPRNSWMFGGQSAYKLLSLYKSLSLSCIIKIVILIQGHEPLAGAVATKSVCHIKWAPNRCWDFDPITCPTAFFWTTTPCELENCYKISPSPHFLAECRKKRQNQSCF